jgi:hypothetical protein
LDRLSEQFSALVFAENPTNEEETTKQEKDMKKLLTITKSKFYMLRVNFPKAFEVSVDRDSHLSHTSEPQHDPLADKIPAVATNLKEHQGPTSAAVNLDEDESEENKKKRAEQIERDKLKY